MSDTKMETHPPEAPLDRSAVMLHQTRPDAIMVRGRGSWLWDNRGRRYLDFVQGWAVNCLGHTPAVVRQTLARQAARLINCSPGFLNDQQLAFCGELARASGLDQTFLASTGAEANEGAIKLARKWGQVHRHGASTILTTNDSFHGRTLATMAASGKMGFDRMFPPAVSGFRKVAFGDAGAVAEAIDGDTVAVMVEPIQGEAGVVVPKAGYLRELRDLTRRHGILLIFDEVQTGMGRTGTLFAYQHEEALPDIMTLGKGIGAGLPLAALVASRDACCFAPGEQGATYSGTPLLAAVGRSVLNRVQSPDFLASVQHRGTFLAHHLEDLSAAHGCAGVRGRGLLWVLDLGRDKANEIVQRARDEEGLLINAPRPRLLRFMPSLVVSRPEIRQMAASLGRVLSAY